MFYYQCRVVYENKHLFLANNDQEAKTAIDKLKKKHSQIKTIELSKIEPQPLLNNEFQPAIQTRLM